MIDFTNMLNSFVNNNKILWASFYLFFLVCALFNVATISQELELFNGGYLLIVSKNKILQNWFILMQSYVAYAKYLFVEND